MDLAELEVTLREHTGEFLCERFDTKERQTFPFTHVTTQPAPSSDIPNTGRLKELYTVFGSILLYHEARTQDAARHIAPASQWAELRSDLNDWFDSLSDDERRELVPDWVDSCLVIGETPYSGNYILVPTEGAEAGRVFEFDHDGFEFVDEAGDVVEYVGGLLNPDSARLTDIASHMSFIGDDPMIQWWILELRDNRGLVVRTTT